MAVIGYPYQRQRPGASRGAVVFKPWKGRIVAQKWPRPRGLPADSEQRARLDWMRDMIREWKQSAPEVTLDAMEAGRITKARPQDWWTRYTAGRMWYMPGPSGKMLTSATFEYCVSTAIDCACAAPGALAVRALDGWRPLPAGNPGAVLIMGTTLPHWSDNMPVTTDQPTTPYAGAVSDALDAITATPGSILMRGPDTWTEIAPGEQGAVLTINADGYPAWQ